MKTNLSILKYVRSLFSIFINSKNNYYFNKCIMTTV